MEDKKFMRRCIELAKKGLGYTYPNPLVGCVIVHNGKIISEGWHKKAGNAHAEVEAVEKIKDKSILKEATLYVNLEPCNLKFKTPAFFDDLLVVHLTLNELPRARVVFSYLITNELQKEVASGSTCLAFLNTKNKRPVRCPDTLMEVIQKLL